MTDRVKIGPKERLMGIEPVMPQIIDPTRAKILTRLQRNPEARTVVLGGFFALSHYLPAEYHRETNDVDAWWLQTSSQEQRQATLTVLRTVMRSVGKESGADLKERQHSEVTYFDLKQGNTVISSFQIAPRDIELVGPFAYSSPWTPIAVESLADNLASKMAALVKRGAPRDFKDIYTVMQQGMVTFEDLLVLWELKVPGGKTEEVTADISNHLASIELRRPLSSLSDEDRAYAEALRTLYHSVLQD